jgi:DNA-directed RNA polymerase specialized sigma24 family protein
MLEQRSSELSAKVETICRDQGRELWALFYAQCCDSDRAYDALQEAFQRLYQQNGAPISGYAFMAVASRS